MKTTLSMPASTGTRSRAVGRLRQQLALWLSLRGERRALLSLDPRMLADLGLTQADLRREAARPPWDVPEARRLRGGPRRD